MTVSLFRAAGALPAVLALAFAAPAPAQEPVPSSSGRLPAIPSPAESGPGPRAPSIVSLRSGGRLKGGLTELFPGTGIFLTSRHVLEGLTPEELSASLGSSGIDLGKNRCYTFRRDGASLSGDDASELDVTLMVPANSRALSFEPEPGPKELSCLAGLDPETNPVPLRARLAPELRRKIERQVTFGEEYRSFQLSRIGRDDALSSRTGWIQSVGLQGAFFLPPYADDGDPLHLNATTAGGSGSLIFTRPIGNTAKPWLAAGMVDCQISTKTTDSGVNVPGAVRVLPITTILDAKAYRVSCTSPKLLEPRPRSKDCIPVDIRGGGGI